MPPTQDYVLDEDGMLHHPNDPVTQYQLSSSMSKLEIKLHAAMKPPWGYIWSAVGVAIVLVSGVYGLAVTPIKETLKDHSDKFTILQHDLNALTIQLTHTADTVERIDKQITTRKLGAN